MEEIIPETDERVKMIEQLQLDKMEMYEKITTYYKYFDIKPNLKIKKDSSMDILEKELCRCEIESNKKTDPIETYKDLFILSGTAIEASTKFFNPLGLELEGLSRVLNANRNKEELDITIKQLIMKYDLYKYNPASPEMKLAKIMFSTCMAVDNFNKSKKENGTSPQTPISTVQTDTKIN